MLIIAYYLDGFLVVHMNVKPYTCHLKETVVKCYSVCSSLVNLICTFATELTAVPCIMFPVESLVIPRNFL